MGDRQKTTFIIDGYDNARGSYIIVEKRGFVSVYCYDGYLRGNTYTLYPRRSLLRGERRDKMTLSVHDVRKNDMGYKKLQSRALVGTVDCSSDCDAVQRNTIVSFIIHLFWRFVNYIGEKSQNEEKKCRDL